MNAEPCCRRHAGLSWGEQQAAHADEYQRRDLYVAAGWVLAGAVVAVAVAAGLVAVLS